MVKKTSTALRIGVIGCGGRGGIAQYMHKPGGDSVVVAGADTDPSQHGLFIKKYGNNAFFTSDYRELLARKDVDAVLVASPDNFH